MSRQRVGRPERSEAAPYYFGYIDRIDSDDILSVLDSQLEPTLKLAGTISDERSLYRYAADKWSIRELLAHVNDTERLFVFRAFWFARGFDSSLPSFDQNIAATAVAADRIPWERHVEEFRVVRLATLAFFRNLPDDAWMRKGIASDNTFTVRALAYLAAGHLAHHLVVLSERYG
jgi:DinB family protein